MIASGNAEIMKHNNKYDENKINGVFGVIPFWGLKFLGDTYIWGGDPCIVN